MKNWVMWRGATQGGGLTLVSLLVWVSHCWAHTWAGGRVGGTYSLFHQIMHHHHHQHCWLVRTGSNQVGVCVCAVASFSQVNITLRLVVVTCIARVKVLLVGIGTWNLRQSVKTQLHEINSCVQVKIGFFEGVKFYYYFPYYCYYYY